VLFYLVYVVGILIFVSGHAASSAVVAGSKAATQSSFRAAIWIASLRSY
jgi:uncharacterized membrane protein